MSTPLLHGYSEHGPTRRDRIDSLGEALTRAYATKGADGELVAATILDELEAMGWTLAPDPLPEDRTHDHACCPPDDCCGGPCAAHPCWELTT